MCLRSKDLVLHVLVIFFCITILDKYRHEHSAMPKIKLNLVALKPKGCRASIADEGGIKFFSFQANINKEIKQYHVGTLNGRITEPKKKEWVFEDENVILEIGDVINYSVYVANEHSYITNMRNFTVKELTATMLDVNINAANPEICFPTLTTHHGSHACSEQVIFQDDFDILDEKLWKIEHNIPTERPEYPFVSYQRSSVQVQNGLLMITPRLQQLQPRFDAGVIYTGTLDLTDGCTEGGLCKMTAVGFNILPPVITGRMVSKVLAFKYGIIEIRAKLPQGDWLYPELLLEPCVHKYGQEAFASGVIKIATAIGNGNLYVRRSNHCNELLFGGTIFSAECPSAFMVQRLGSSRWGEHFHTYALRWEPDRLIFFVDGIEWGRLEAGVGLRSQLPEHCHTSVRTGGKLTPFDMEFHLTLGVAAGGVVVFADQASSSRRPKPWENKSSKAKLHFWNDVDTWHRSWGNHSALIVDSVKVIAL